MTAKKQTVLVADDDIQLLRLVARSLELEDFAVLLVKNGEDALIAIETQEPDIVLLDIQMPKLDGFKVCQKVREFSSVPIIILTARGHDDDKIKGLNLGADDYLAKPFNVDELIARIRAVLRRAQANPDEPIPTVNTHVTIGDIYIDYTQHLVIVRGQEVHITPTEYRILVYLVQNLGRVVTQGLLLDRIWGDEYTGESHMLQVNINRLRRKIEVDPTHPHYILTKSGVGYQFVSPSQGKIHKATKGQEYHS